MSAAKQAAFQQQATAKPERVHPSDPSEPKAQKHIGLANVKVLLDDEILPVARIGSESHKDSIVAALSFARRIRRVTKDAYIPGSMPKTVISPGSARGVPALPLAGAAYRPGRTAKARWHVAAAAASVVTAASSTSAQKIERTGDVGSGSMRRRGWGPRRHGLATQHKQQQGASSALEAANAAQAAAAAAQAHEKVLHRLQGLRTDEVLQELRALARGGPPQVSAAPADVPGRARTATLASPAAAPGISASMPLATPRILSIGRPGRQLNASVELPRVPPARNGPHGTSRLASSMQAMKATVDPGSSTVAFDRLSAVDPVNHNSSRGMASSGQAAAVAVGQMASIYSPSAYAGMGTGDEAAAIHKS